MREFHFWLDIYYSTFRQYYSAPNAHITVETEENRQRIKLPCVYLRPFITHSGIRGRFKITLDARNKVKGIKQVS